MPVLSTDGVKAAKSGRYKTKDLVWRPTGVLERFVFVTLNGTTKRMFMSTSLGLDALEVVTLYSLRFKIELGRKRAFPGQNACRLCGRRKP